MGDVVDFPLHVTKIDGDLVSGTIVMRVAKDGFNHHDLADARSLAETIVRDLLVRYGDDDGRYVEDPTLSVWATDVVEHHDADGKLEGWSVAVKFERPWCPEMIETESGKMRRPT
jgi:hypothetical protein